MIAFNLRAAVTSVGPVLREVMASTGLTPGGASVLTTLPSLCFGAFAPLAPWLARRFGTERALLIVVLTIAVGTALRGFGTLPALFGGSAIAFGAIGAANVLLPGLVKRDFPHRVATMTGLYSMALCAGAAVAAGVTVPVEQAFGGSWAVAMAFWGAPALLAALLWAPQMPPREGGAGRARPRVGGLWRDALAWQVTLFMGLQSALAYIVFGWLPAILRDRGFSAVDAGLVLSVSVVAQAAACLLAPWLATRGRDQRLANAGSVALCLVGMLGCMFAPLPTVWGWAVALGISQGALIAIALTVIVLRSPDSHVAAQLSGMAQGVGYLLASGGPLLAGLLRAWTGGWTAVAILFAAICGAAAAFGIGAGRAKHVRAG